MTFGLMLFDCIDRQVIVFAVAFALLVLACQRRA